MKQCSKCGKKKPKSSFYECSSGTRDGLNSWCKNCFNKKSLEYHRLNKEKNRQWQKKYYYSNQESILVKAKKYQQEKRKSSEDFREKENIRWHNRQARIRENGGTFTLKEWQDLKKKYNYTCQMCGKKEPEIKLTKDHIISLKNKGKNIIENIQPLCGSCNSKKGTK